MAGLIAWWVFRPAGRNPDIPGLVPLPARVELHRGHFVLTSGTRIIATPESRSTGEYLAEALRKSTGYPLPLETGSNAGTGNILLNFERPHAGQNLEGYQLSAKPDGVTISSPGSAGLFYGVQTLFELLPSDVLDGDPALTNRWELPSVTGIFSRKKRSNVSSI